MLISLFVKTTTKKHSRRLHVDSVSCFVSWSGCWMFPRNTRFITFLSISFSQFLSKTQKPDISGWIQCSQRNTLLSCRISAFMYVRYITWRKSLEHILQFMQPQSWGFFLCQLTVSSNCILILQYIHSRDIVLLRALRFDRPLTLSMTGWRLKYSSVAALHFALTEAVVSH